MTGLLGWGLALVAVAVSYVFYGWRGVLLAVSVTVFWLLLQISRAVRTLRVASERPMGTVPSAVMLHAQLRSGLRLPEVLMLTRSLGRRVADDPETFVWEDEAGDAVRVEFRRGRCSAWTLQRRAAPDA
jgi:hypothetical protein